MQQQISHLKKTTHLYLCVPGGTDEAEVHLGPQRGGCPGLHRLDGELSCGFYMELIHISYDNNLKTIFVIFSHKKEKKKDKEREKDRDRERREDRDRSRDERERSTSKKKKSKDKERDRDRKSDSEKGDVKVRFGA